jgi:predicted LPLAT superfamily acyltransferase
MVEWSGDAQTKIAAERRKFLTPIDEAEHTVLSELSTAYADLTAAQALLTARLQVAADLKDEQDRVLQQLRVDKTFANVKQQLGEVSRAVGAALSTVDDKLDDKAIVKLVGERLRTELHQTLAERPGSSAPSPQP